MYNIKTFLQKPVRETQFAKTDMAKAYRNQPYLLLQNNNITDYGSFHHDRVRGYTLSCTYSLYARTLRPTVRQTFA